MRPEVEQDRQRIGRLCWGDQRGIYDTTSGYFYTDTIGWQQTGPADAYCLGVGRGSSDHTPWKWMLVPMFPGEGDGARISYTDIQIVLSSVDPRAEHVELCDKAQARQGIAQCQFAWVPLKNRVPVTAEGGTGTDAWFIGLDSLNDRVLTLAQVTPSGLVTWTPLSNGDLTALLQIAVPIRTPNGHGVEAPTLLGDSVFDRTGHLWVSMHAPCVDATFHVHVCPWVMQVNLAAKRIETFYVFHADWGDVDGYLPAMTVTTAGVPLLTWVVSGDVFIESMAVGGLYPVSTTPGAVVAEPFFHIPYRGQASSPNYLRKDFLGIDHIGELAFANGYYMGGPNGERGLPGTGNPISAVVGFTPQCNWITGVCP